MKTTILSTLLLIICLAAMPCKALKITKGSNIRILSFNILRGDLGANDSQKWPARKDAVFAMLQNNKPLLIGLQECNWQQRQDILAQFPHYASVGVGVDGSESNYECSSNPIFYHKKQFKLDKWGSFWFSDTPQQAGSFTWNASKPRNATWALLQMKKTGKKFIYINMHIQNGVNAADNRAKCILLVTDKLKEINPDNLPLIFSGDLNSSYEDAYYAPWRAFMKEAAETCEKTDRGTTFNGFREGVVRYFDHILYKDMEGLLFSVDRKAYKGVKDISDHYPVFADLKL